MAKVALIFDVFMPYHHARLRAAQDVATVVGIEVAGASFDYSWASTQDGTTCHVLFPGRRSDDIPMPDLRRALFACLDTVSPTIVFVPGWSAPAALLAISWCHSRRRYAVMMCDSTAIDLPRVHAKEIVKRRLLAGCAATLVSGTRSAEYVAALGIAADTIRTGYDAVDNDHFAHGAAAVRADAAELRPKMQLPERYLLCVCRLVAKKNVANLLAGYRAFRDASRGGNLPDLVIAGTGEDAAHLRRLTDQLALTGNVHFVGHIDYETLPKIYGLADGLILASRIEPWGLVANEAAAAGLPLLLSDRCGASTDLVADGENGWRFDPEAPLEIAAAMKALAEHPDWSALSKASERRVSEWGLARFRSGLSDCIAIAQRCGRPPSLATALLSRLLVALPRAQAQP